MQSDKENNNNNSNIKEEVTDSIKNVASFFSRYAKQKNFFSVSVIFVGIIVSLFSWLGSALVAVGFALGNISHISNFCFNAKDIIAKNSLLTNLVWSGTIFYFFFKIPVFSLTLFIISLILFFMKKDKSKNSEESTKPTENN